VRLARADKREEKKENKKGTSDFQCFTCGSLTDELVECSVKSRKKKKKKAMRSH